jgi:hypothetical protein
MRSKRYTAWAIAGNRDVTVRDVLAVMVPLAFTIFGFMRWRENGYWVPRFVHVAAVFAELIAAALVWMSVSIDAPNKDRMWSILLVMPLLVYWAYLIYGGGAGERRYNDHLSMHASMHERDVLTLLKRHFAPYRLRTFAELRALIGQPDVFKLKGETGLDYEMRVSTQTDRGDPTADVIVFAELGELGRKRGVPVAITMFSKTSSGVLGQDGLNMPFRSKWRR